VFIILKDLIEKEELSSNDEDVKNVSFFDDFLKDINEDNDLYPDAISKWNKVRSLFSGIMISKDRWYDCCPIKFVECDKVKLICSKCNTKVDTVKTN
jgi:hypothetical protein